jgi:aspartyl-tRNA(Asn)/glutamyl-tRNA(Gln) amidotransferase subunit A
VELAQEALRRIEAWQPVTNAFSQIRPEETLAEAHTRADSVVHGQEVGALHGVPVAVKDLFDVAGWATTGCCDGYRGRVAEADAEAVRRLRAAGAVIVGKTNQHELAAGATNLVSACGPTANPWDRSRITGGSSGGSGAAVASACVPLALGTDTGGSVRIPSSMCGIVGLKPTPGRVSLEGVMPLAPSFDTVGPMGRTSADLAVAFRVLIEDSSVGVTGGPLEHLMVGVAEDEVATMVRSDVASSVGRVVDLLEDVAERAPVRVMSSYDPEDWARLAWRELFEHHGRLLQGAEALGTPTRQLLERGRDVPIDELEGARRRAVQVRKDFLEALRVVDAIVMPATPFPAPRADQVDVDIGDGRTLNVRRGAISILTRPINLAGLPALAVPSGFSEEGLPLGTQVVGRPGEEETLLRLGRLIEERSGMGAEPPEPPGLG